MRDAVADRGRRMLLTGRLDEVGAAEVHIASLVVYADPARAANISDAIGKLSGAEVHATDGRGKLVVVLETESDAKMAATIDSVDRIAGVFCTALVHQQTEQLAPGE